MSGSSHLESSDESTGDEKETKITIHKQEITDTETDKCKNHAIGCPNCFYNSHLLFSYFLHIPTFTDVQDFYFLHLQILMT